jgi:hypothetical protein
VCVCVCVCVRACVCVCVCVRVCFVCYPAGATASLVSDLLDGGAVGPLLARVEADGQPQSLNRVHPGKLHPK